jgi:hypothetical protein
VRGTVEYRRIPLGNDSRSGHPNPSGQAIPERATNRVFAGARGRLNDQEERVAKWWDEAERIAQQRFAKLSAQKR